MGNISGYSILDKLRLFSVSLLTAMMPSVCSGEIIAQWNFNSPFADSDVGIGSLVPSIGPGQPAIVIGGVSQRFGTVLGGTANDPSAHDNSQWRLGTTDNFPPQGTGNRTTGVKFAASVVGFQNIRIGWDQENSARASKYWRLQHTTNGVTWVDNNVVVASDVASPPDGTPFWQTGLAATLASAVNVNNNPNFGFRLVAEFESSATGSGFPGYIANRSTAEYSVSGTMWLDMVTIYGTPTSGGPEQIIAQWNFNSISADSTPSTGTLSPSIGNGLAQVMGEVAYRFGSVAGGSTSDPNAGDNSQLRFGSSGTGGFPADDVGNKSAGVQFMANTIARRNIIVGWDQENSATASRYWRVQYTTNGIEWIDRDVITAAHVGQGVYDTPAWQTGLTADFRDVIGANNNPNFGFRLVSEFESSAIGAGSATYVANRPGSEYGNNGTLWLDMVTIYGETTNNPPTLQSPGTLTDTGYTLSNLTPSFLWIEASNATRYGLYISREPYVTANLIFSNETVTGTSFKIPSGYLLPGTKYRWNMRAFDLHGGE